MRLSKCCDAEVKFGMVDDQVGHGMHEETECSNCGELYPKVYDDEELILFYKDKQSGEVLSEEEMLESVDDDDDELGSFYLIGTFNTKEEAIDHLKTLR
jgi:hypothetical protein